MTEKINLVDACHQIDLPDGSKIVLFDRLAKEDQFTKLEVARNIYRVAANGDVKWQIQTKFDEEGDPFTSLRMQNGLSAYRWDGVRYGVDLETGEAIPLLLEK